MNRNIEIVKSIYNSFLQANIPAILEHFHPDIEWEHDTKNYGIPWLQPRRGRNDVVNFFSALSALDITRFEPVNFLADDNHVAVTIHLEAIVKKSGYKASDFEMHFWTFDNANRVIRFRHFVDTVLHLTASHAHG